VLARGRTGAGAPDGLVALLDPVTGRPRWQRRVGGDVFPNSLAVGPAGIQLVAQDPLTFEQLIAKRQRADWSPLHVRLLALGPTGRPRWRRPLSEVTGGDDPIEDVRVTAAGSRVVAVSQRQHGARIEVFEAGTGARSWSRPAERAGGVLAWRDRLLLDLCDRRPSVRARDGAVLRAEFLPAGAATPTSDPASSQLHARPTSPGSGSPSTPRPSASGTGWCWCWPATAACTWSTTSGVPPWAGTAGSTNWRPGRRWSPRPRRPST
jgi:hypothetical protein